MNEKWTQKYKKSIDCSNPKGFSQRAHCQGRKKTFKEMREDMYGFSLGPTDVQKPMASLGGGQFFPNRKYATTLPALSATYQGPGAGTYKPMLSANTKKEAINLDTIKKGAQRFAKGIYDKLKRLATTKQRYEYAAKVLQDVIDRKEIERARQGLSLRHDIGYYAAAVAQTFHDIDSKKLVGMVKEELSPFKKKVLQKLTKPIKDYNKKKKD